MKSLLLGVFSGFFLISCVFGATGKSSPVIKVSDASGARGQKVSVAISVTPVEGDIYGVDLQLEYNPAHLQFSNAETGALTVKWNVTAKDNNAHNKVSIGLYSASALPKAKGSIAVVNFIVKADAPVRAKSLLHLNKADFNEKPVKAVKDGKFTVRYILR